jgi:hypothetical protein
MGIWTTGHTEGLRWEIKHLLESVPPQKLFLWLHVDRSPARQRMGKIPRSLSGCFSAGAARRGRHHAVYRI